jgi:hypothetical protein
MKATARLAGGSASTEYPRNEITPPEALRRVGRGPDTVTMGAGPRAVKRHKLARGAGERTSIRLIWPEGERPTHLEAGRAVDFMA